MSMPKFRCMDSSRTLSREEIFTPLCGIEYDGQDRSIDVRISRIRPKLGDDLVAPRLIKTIRGKGHLFVREVAEELRPPPAMRCAGGQRVALTTARIRGAAKGEV